MLTPKERAVLAEARAIKRRARESKPKAPRQKPKQGRVRDNGHLAYLRRLPCACCGVSGRSEAAHIRYGDPARGKANPGMGAKPDDRWAVPMCRDCHRAQHGMNERAFWAEAGIDPLVLAEDLWAVSGNEVAGATVLARRQG